MCRYKWIRYPVYSKCNIDVFQERCGVECNITGTVKLIVGNENINRHVVFNRSLDSEWAAPTFIQATKTGDAHILTDFRRINAQIKRKPFSLPKISDMLRKLSGFKYATAIDRRWIIITYHWT
jgi:hypothetical protein